MKIETTSSPTSSERSHGLRSLVALVAWLALAGLQIAAAFLVGSEAEERELLYSYELAVGALVFDGLLIGLTFAIAAAYPDPLAALGLRRFARRWLWAAFGMIFLALVVGALLETVFDLEAGEEQGLVPESWRPERLPALLVNGFITVTLVPFAEELFFRGLGVRVLSVFGAAVAVFGTALAFALVHGILVALPTFIVFAAGLAWVRLRSGSVWPGVLAHGLYNGLVLSLSLALI